MKARKYTEEQIIGVLREGEAGAKIATLCVSMEWATPPTTTGSRSTHNMPSATNYRSVHIPGRSGWSSGSLGNWWKQGSFLTLSRSILLIYWHLLNRLLEYHIIIGTNYVEGTMEEQKDRHSYLLDFIATQHTQPSCMMVKGEIHKTKRHSEISILTQCPNSKNRNNVLFTQCNGR